MEKQGWKDGEGLGHSQAGIPEALENEGQHPNCKRGFGYIWTQPELNQFNLLAYFETMFCF